MLKSLRDRTVSPAVVYFVCSRLILFIAVITAYHVTKPLESTAQLTHTALAHQRMHPARAETVLPAPDHRTYAEHAANIALQSARIADLHHEEQELLCETLVNASCDDMANARCVAIVQQCHGLGALHDEIVKERLAVEVIFGLGFIELETLCEQTIARSGQLTIEQAEWREAYRTTLLEHFDALSELLRQRSAVLKPLRTAAQELGGEAMLAELEVPRRREAARAAADSILESVAAIHLGRRERLAPRDRTSAPDVQPAYDPRIPPCGGDVQCWEI